MSEISREPSDYRPTMHAKQQRKARNIPWDEVGETIRSGELRNSHKDGCKLFIKDFPYFDRPVGVVVDYLDGKVVTIEWRKD